MHRNDHPSRPIQAPEDSHNDAVDPVCGMTVDPQVAAGTSVHEGRTYYFCSTACVEQFTADPKKYTGRRSAIAAPGSPPAPRESEAMEYTCPMHPEVRQRGLADARHAGWP